jgi:hypothetical protein
MSCQFNFYCMIEELNTLLPILQKYEATIIGAHRFSERPEVLSDFSSERKLRGKYIFLNRCLNDIVWNRLNDSEQYVDSSVSPVIEAIIWSPTNGVLCRARLYMQKGFDGRNGWIAYPEELLKLYHSLVSALKRKVLTTEVRNGMRCSSSALKFEVDGGNLSLF